jgi:hypothetical protein
MRPSVSREHEQNKEMLSCSSITKSQFLQFIVWDFWGRGWDPTIGNSMDHNYQEDHQDSNNITI